MVALFEAWEDCTSHSIVDSRLPQRREGSQRNALSKNYCTYSSDLRNVGRVQKLVVQRPLRIFGINWCDFSLDAVLLELRKDIGFGLP